MFSDIALDNYLHIGDFLTATIDFEPKVCSRSGAGTDEMDVRRCEIAASSVEEVLKNLTAFLKKCRWVASRLGVGWEWVGSGLRALLAPPVLPTHFLRSPCPDADRFRCRSLGNWKEPEPEQTLFGRSASFSERQSHSLARTIGKRLGHFVPHRTHVRLLAEQARRSIPIRIRP